MNKLHYFTFFLSFSYSFDVFEKPFYPSPLILSIFSVLLNLFIFFDYNCLQFITAVILFAFVQACNCFRLVTYSSKVQALTLVSLSLSLSTNSNF